MFEVAVAANISPETLRKIETGRVATPAFSTIAAIAAVLGLSLDEVWSEINQPTQASTYEHVSGQRTERLAS
jgi:transcriptional regulator with XRE-family HTH domain